MEERAGRETSYGLHLPSQAAGSLTHRLHSRSNCIRTNTDASLMLGKKSPSVTINIIMTLISRPITTHQHLLFLLFGIIPHLDFAMSITVINYAEKLVTSSSHIFLPLSLQILVISQTAYEDHSVILLQLYFSIFP